MRFEQVQRLEATVEAVEAALVDRRFLATLAETPKLGRPVVLEQRHDGHRTFQRVRYNFEGDLNPTARTFIDPRRLSWVEESTQDRDTHVTAVAIVPDHYTTTFSCSAVARLEAGERPGHCVRTTTGEVVVRIPLVGPRAEAAIVSGLREHAEAEEEALNRWLAGAGRERSAG